MKRALISVYDKQGIVEFAKALVELGWEIISTGGTQKLLEESGVAAIPVENVTKFPEILAGRVKTLHPSIHAGILYKRDSQEQAETLAELKIDSIDMVVNNLYPFEESVKNPDSTLADNIENIDIGGPSMIRAAAKNYHDVLVVVDPDDYSGVIEALKAEKVDLAYRQNLAAKAFQTTAFYDSMIAEYFNSLEHIKFPKLLSIPYRYAEELRYGENPHQEAVYYRNPLTEDYELEQLHGKQISYNNYNDLRANMDLLTEFEEPACVAVKHVNPCGVAIGSSPKEAYQKAFECDPESIYGGIVGFNRTVDLETAELLAKTFLEIIVAPDFTEDGFNRLAKKKNIRLIKCPNLNTFSGKKLAFKETTGGLLLQDRDNQLYNPEDFKVVTEAQPTEAELKEMEFAWKVVKHCASNSIIITKNGQSLGLGHGEVRRVWALEDALTRTEFDSLEGAVAASDGFFFDDTIELLNKYGIKAIVEPGGSKQDPKVIEAANKHGISVCFTGMRHFKH